MMNRFHFWLPSFFVVVGLLMPGINLAAVEQPPILVLATDYRFGSFTGEILKTEGFNEFQMLSLSDANITLTYLQQFDVVILTEMVLSEPQSRMLTAYVSSGGNLIAFRPDKKLSPVFGITRTGVPVKDGYVTIDTRSAVGKGLIAQSLQFHGEADRCTLGSGQAIATLSPDSVATTASPAVVMNAFDKGHAMAFLYNLPQNIVYTRQGNYRDAAREMDGILGLRAMDLFTHGYVNTSRNTINQADEQMRLLSHGIERLSSFRKPIPHFWYFPDSLKCLVTLNNDGEDSREAEFVQQFNDVEAKGAGMTLYIKEVELISKEWVTEWAKKGFEMSGHPDDTKQAAHPDWKTMDSVYKALLRELKTEYGIDGMQTVTNHWFVWCGKNEKGSIDFAAQARIEAQNGVGLDCNYAHYDNGSDQGHFLGEMGTRQGNYTGSGLAMKFAGPEGKVIDVFQQLNNVYDQQYMEHKDQAGYLNCFKGLMDRSLDNEVYSVICVRAHNNEYYFSKVPLMKMLDYANEKGVPVWTEVRFLEFLRAREEATFNDVQWEKNQLSFTLKSSLKHSHGLTWMMPYEYDGKPISKIQSNGTTPPYSVGSVKGFKYAMVTVAPGVDYRVVVHYSH